MASSSDRERVVYVAKLAMQAKRYDEVIEAMKKVAEMRAGELSGDERNLLSEGYKKKIRCLRCSWGVLFRLGEIEFLGRENRNQINLYIHKVEREIHGIGHQVTALVRMPLSFTSRWDYWRYQAEYKTGLSWTQAVKRSSIAYMIARDKAVMHLPPAHPVRLGLALNFAVFNYEILDSTDWACNITKNTFFKAAPGLGRLNQEMYKESIKIMDLLWENTILWKAGAEDYWSEGEDK